MFITFALATAIACRAACESYDSLWEQYSAIHGEHLLEVFTSPEALSNAHSYARKLSHSEESMAFVCSDYWGKAKKSKNEEMSLLPVLVDEKKALICYLSIPWAITDAGWKFSVSNAAGLKLNPSLYRIIETSDHSLISAQRSNKLTVMYRPEYFSAGGQQYEEAGEDHFRNVIASLSQYSLAPFEHFYWTANEVQHFYRSHEADQDFERDAARAELWGKLRRTFEQSIDVKADSCRFSSWEGSAEYQIGKVSLPLFELVGDINSDGTLSTACLAYAIASLASDPSTNFLTITKPVELLNFRARSIQQSATASSSLSASPYTKAGLRGGGQIVQITDTGVDMTNCYFSDPADGCGDTSDEPSGHGTHVSGTVVGSIQGANIENQGKYDGVAPDGKLVFVDLGKPGTGLCIPRAKDLYSPGYNAGARVSSNSWGGYYSGNGYYASQDVDAYLYKRPQSLILFAAGNGGQQGTKSLTIEANGKSPIAVGSSETTYGGPNITYVAFYSSKGPTYDGRIKPDIVAPGDSIESALSNGDSGKSCGTTTMTGTSMATPSAAGAALLLRNYFMTADPNFWAGMCNPSYNFCGPFTPSGVLIKALLINSGSEMTLYHGGGAADIPLGPPPDTMQGFGRVTLCNIAPLKNVYDKFDLYVDDLRTILPDTGIAYSVNVTNNVTPLRATLAWYDPPNVGGVTTKALIHDLDLIVTSPNGKTYFGNGKTTVDTLNTVEQVVIASPAPGVWKIAVKGKAMPYADSQQYSIVINSHGSVKE